MWNVESVKLMTSPQWDTTHHPKTTYVLVLAVFCTNFGLHGWTPCQSIRDL